MQTFVMDGNNLLHRIAPLRKILKKTESDDIDMDDQELAWWVGLFESGDNGKA